MSACRLGSTMPSVRVRYFATIWSLVRGVYGKLHPRWREGRVQVGWAAMIAFLSLFLTVQDEGATRGRGFGSPTSAERPASAGFLEAETDGRRSIDLRLALSSGPIRVERGLSDRAADRHSLASNGLPTVLALEVALSWRSARIPAEIRRLIRDMSLANRLWGAPRIHGELLKLGSKSLSRRSPNTWRRVGEGGRRPGRPFSITMRRASAR
jgi:hypothetical protein